MDISEQFFMETFFGILEVCKNWAEKYKVKFRKCKGNRSIFSFLYLSWELHCKGPTGLFTPLLAYIIC